MKIKKLIAMILCVCMLASVLTIVSSAEENSVTISFADTSTRVSQDTESQVWSQNGITVTGNKAKSTNDVKDYSNPARFYKSSTVTVEYANMTKIVIDAPTNESGKYANAWVDSCADTAATATVDGATVTITFAEPVDTFTMAMAAQGRAYEMTVYYAVEGGATKKTPANLTTDIGIMYCGALGQYEGVTTLITATGDYSFTWDKFAVFEKVDGNVYKVIQAGGGSQTVVNVTLTEGQFIIAANAGNDWPSLTQGTGWWTGQSNSHGVPYEECPNFCSAHITAWFATVGSLEVGTEYEVVGIDLANPVVDTSYVVDFDSDPTYGYTKADYVTYSYLTPAYEGVNGGSDESTLTIEEAIALGESMEHNTYTDIKYYVTGVIESVYNTQYGNMYIVDDAGNRLTIYGTYSADGELRYDALETKPVAGDTVVILGIVGQYNGTAQIKNGWIVNHTPGEGGNEEETPDPEADSILTIEEAIALGESKTHNVYTENKYYVTGTITEIYNEQYGNMKITDEDGNILTVYGTYSADGEVRFDSMETKPVVGDVVTVYGIVGQYNGVAQVKNGWITAINPEVEGDESDTGNGEGTPEMGDASIAVVAVVMLVAMAGVAVVYRRRRA